MTMLEQIKQIATQTCGGIVCDTCPLVTATDERSSKDIAKIALDLLSYDSDFSQSKVGDWVWIIMVGWVRIADIDYTHLYPITLTNGNSYTLDGKFMKSNRVLAAFITPPVCFNPETKPEPVCPFKRGDKVLVSNQPDDEKNYRYFAEYIPENILCPYFCFVHGRDEWSSKGKMYGWEFCEAYEGEN